MTKRNKKRDLTFDLPETEVGELLDAGRINHALESIRSVFALLTSQEASHIVRTALPRLWFGGEEDDVGDVQSSLTFGGLRAVNVCRCEADNGFGHHLNAWMIDQWTNAMQGEAGEAGNFAKKISRIRHTETADRVNKKHERDEHELLDKMAREVAGMVIYADLTLASENLSLEEYVRKEFNAKSKEIKYKGTGL